MSEIRRRNFIAGLAVAAVGSAPAFAIGNAGQRLADAARAQVGVTTVYDPDYTRIPYPNGDVPRSRGVCADVIVRAARDGLGIDLQKLVHEDMAAHFEAYPSRRAWGARGPDASIDHRRVLNLEVYFTRVGARVWAASGPVPGDGFPLTLAVGDSVSWLLDARLPHIGMVVSVGATNAGARVVHNIGRGTEESEIEEFRLHRAVGQYRWPRVG
jgi:hypothetical protein